MQLSPGKLWGMRRMANANGHFKMTAVDQRPPIKNAIAKHYGRDEAPYEDVARFKALLIEILQSESTAMLLDPHYAIPVGLDTLDPRKGLIVTLEDSLFTENNGGRLSAEIDDWSVGSIKRLGGDAVKVLAWYRPDADESVRRKQQDFTRQIGDACAHFDIPFLFELLVYPLAGDQDQTRDYVEMKGKLADHVLDSVAEFAKPEYGVDVFKLESPVNASNVPGIGNPGWEEVQAVYDEMGNLAGRPWVMLSAGANKAAFRKIMSHAYKAGASGYLAGRAIWLEAFSHFPDWDGIRRELESDALDYMRDLNALTDEMALPFGQHDVYQGEGARFHPADGSFRHKYMGL